ncbi:MAG: 30S ribosomal protein S2 [Parcubacteria group bacterium GW2011_GWC1_41_7]|nr:MAG: 30S ribosomal protein S2 [Parcubacteria group bacterium GW2011_GWC1_41_7]
MENQTIQQTDQKNDAIKRMLSAGVQYGRLKRFTQTRMRRHLMSSNIKNMEIFNLDETNTGVEKVSEVIKKTIADNKKVLFVGTHAASIDAVKNMAVSLDQPYVNFKWIGGFLTNFETVKSRLKYFNDLKEKVESGQIAEYSTRDRVAAKKEYEKMAKSYEGVCQMSELPALIFLVNGAYKMHQTVIREARIKKIPIVGIAGSDNNPETFLAYIPANDRAPKSIAFIAQTLLERLGQNKSADSVQDRIVEITSSEE